MSDDDDDYYDDDDYFWLDDGPVNEADDLAQHTMPSPVWNDFDPDQDVGEIFSDWEYYSDDYYDQGEAVTIRHEDKVELASGKKRKNSSQPRVKAKRRRVDHIGAVPRLSLGEPLDSTSTGMSAVVRWKKDSTFTAPPLPILGDDGGEQVALLKDWRDRFKIRLRDHPKELETKTGDYEVPVMRGGLLVIERGNQADGDEDACKAAPGVEVEQNHTGSINHLSPEAPSCEVPTMRNGVSVSERGVHPTVPRKVKATVNGTQSRRRQADIEEESDPRQTKRKATATPETNTDSRQASLPTKSVSRKRRLSDPPEPVEKHEIALRTQGAIQHNLQHDTNVKVSLPTKKSEKLPKAGKENDGTSPAPTARRSKRAKQGS